MPSMRVSTMMATLVAAAALFLIAQVRMHDCTPPPPLRLSRSARATMTEQQLVASAALAVDEGEGTLSRSMRWRADTRAFIAQLEPRSPLTW